METLKLQDQLKLKQMEMNLTTSDSEKKEKLVNDIKIINYKLNIERIKQLIQALQNH